MTPSELEMQPTASQALPADSRPVQTAQPGTQMAMDPQKPHPESEDQVHLRGGDRGGPCPGRFCFIIPCPIPCDFCFIPL